jgi:hypothetical protein
MTKRAAHTVLLLALLLCVAETAWAQQLAAPSDGVATGADRQNGSPGKPSRYDPGSGFKIIDTDLGDVNFRVFTYVRYLNQRLTDPTYTDSFGKISDVQQRQDIQFQKLLIYFYGWLLNPKFRYLTYVWTSNTSLGTSSSVVVAGNLTYQFSRRFTLGAGIASLPGVRSTEGSFPHWLSVDSRLIADEFLRPSYTTGLFARGDLGSGLHYDAMLGNNLSQFGIDAGQLDNDLDTVALALTWMPTTGEFGRSGAFGDFEGHDKVATRFGAHFTRSDESRQAQPTTDAFDNVQLRVSDGNVIFAPGLFAAGTQIDEATYRMWSIDGGVKYRGVSFDVEYYNRDIDHFVVRGALPFSALHDTGFQVQASAMPIRQQLQAYVGGSKVFGEYGDPSDFRAGVNFYPWKNQVVRWNAEYLRLNRSPVGALNLPYSVGMNGPVFHSSLMVWF